MKSFWKDLPKPIMVLAPMEGVTDTVFRRVINLCGRPTVYFTEFTNVDGLFSKGAKAVDHRLKFYPEEKPLVAQLWGENLENYTKAAELAAKSGFDGIDINMGCPEKSVVKRGECAGLIHRPEHAAKIIEAVKKGAGDLPVSVKTRLGITQIETPSWITFLLEQNIDALTIHLRTVREMSKVTPHYDELKKIVDIRNKISPETPIIANGDIESIVQGEELANKYGIEGFMVGRGIFKDPFLFNGKQKLEDLTFQDRMDLLLKHSELFEDEWGQAKHFAILRKFYKIYTHGLPNAASLREKLMTTNNLSEVRDIINKV